MRASDMAPATPIPSFGLLDLNEAAFPSQITDPDYDLSRRNCEEPIQATSEAVMPDSDPMPQRSAFGAVVLTMNDRPDEFPRAMASLQAQEGVDLEIVVVGNGCAPHNPPKDVRTIELPENLGIPEGRNIGAAAVGGEFIFFFDNDAYLPSRDVLTRLAAELQRDPRLAFVQPRIVAPDGRTTLRRWVPRLRAGDPSRPGTVTVMAEGVVAVRRSAFEEVGGWPGHFFLGHEGIDLSWRLWDRGYIGRYSPSIMVEHPATRPERHSIYYRLNARNRVWVAKRNLPWVLITPYLATWIILMICRIRSWAALREWFQGLREGIIGGHGKRDVMSWRTIARLTIAGRPPVV
ncbi:glycosyltransferase family 2 protein [Microtetraspora malaysiensis]|uniref:glycosyltransferase family 2 protein n=1 Tax=Microtetraspora malaysiensis TaxID=161358 RepID=UPI003D9105D9